MTTPFHPFTVTRRRAAVTGEEDFTGKGRSPLNPGLDWIGYQNRGGGAVPPDVQWTTNPKQYQEENGGGTVRTPPGEDGPGPQRGVSGWM